jgi:hypothetical protein
MIRFAVTKVSTFANANHAGNTAACGRQQIPSIATVTPSTKAGFASISRNTRRRRSRMSSCSSRICDRSRTQEPRAGSCDPEEGRTAGLTSKRSCPERPLGERPTTAYSSDRAGNPGSARRSARHPALALPTREVPTETEAALLHLRTPARGPVVLEHDLHRYEP